MSRSRKGARKLAQLQWLSAPVDSPSAVAVPVHAATLFQRDPNGEHPLAHATSCANTFAERLEESASVAESTASVKPFSWASPAVTASPSSAAKAAAAGPAGPAGLLFPPEPPASLVAPEDELGSDGIRGSVVLSTAQQDVLNTIAKMPGMILYADCKVGK